MPFDTPPSATPMLSLSALESGGGGPDRGLAIPADTNPWAVAPHFDAVERIAIDAGPHSEEQARALAQRLRALGYEGALHAA